MNIPTDEVEADETIDVFDTLVRERDELRAELERVRSNHVTVAEEIQRRHDACAPLTAEIERLRAASPDDIRAKGWSVAVHNDYRYVGVQHTFWLFTKDGRAVKGEGRTDTDALAEVRKQIA